MRLGALAIAAISALSALACGSPPPPSPSAVIRACPAAVCLGDAFTTGIHLDATKSAAHLTLVYVPPKPGDPPLDMRWSFSGAAMQYDTGGATDPDILVYTAADRPLHVTLHVENSEGGVAEETRSIAVTPLDAAGNCPLPDPETDDTGDCPDIGSEVPPQ
jgi:hypothetical protein